MSPTPLQVQEFTRTSHRNWESAMHDNYKFITAKGYKLKLKAVKGEEDPHRVWKA